MTEDRWMAEAGECVRLMVNVVSMPSSFLCFIYVDIFSNFAVAINIEICVCSLRMRYFSKHQIFELSNLET